MHLIPVELFVNTTFNDLWDVLAYETSYFTYHWPNNNND